jgi:hypothetical protein
MANAWVEHVRKFASKNGISYGCAVSDPECKASYHKQKARNAKKTRTPAQETEGMGAEDVNVAEKPKPKAKASNPKPKAKASNPKAKAKPREPKYDAMEYLKKLVLARIVLYKIREDAGKDFLGPVVYKKLKELSDLVFYGKYFEDLTEHINPRDAENEIVSYSDQVNYRMEEEPASGMKTIIKIAKQFGINVTASKGNIKDVVITDDNLLPKWLIGFLDERLNNVKYPVES